MKGLRHAVVFLLVAVGILAAAFVISACGSSSSSDSDSSASPTASTADNSSNQDYAWSQLEPLLAVPTFEPAGPAFDAKSMMAGKSILSIPGTGTDPFYVQMNNGMQSAADEVGYGFSVWNNQGQLTQYQQGMANGIQKRVNLIDLLAGPDPNALKPQIEDAQAAGIPVVISHNTGYEQEVPYVDHILATDYKLAGQLCADWVIYKDPTAHVLVIVSEEILATESMKNGIEEEFAKYGPDIEYKYVNVPIPEWGTKITPAVRSAILADPNLTYIICIYDSMSQFVTPAVDATDSADQVKIVGFNGTPFVLDLVREGKVEADIGESLEWAGWAIADAEMRIIGGMEVPKDMKIPYRLFTKDNAAEAGIPASFSEGYGDFKPGYQQLWGLQ